MNLSVRDVAKLLNVSERTIYRWIDRGTLPVYRMGDQFKFNRTELLEWATSRRLNVSADIVAEPESAGGEPCRLSDALKAGGIFYRIGGDDKASVLRSVVEVLRLPDEVDREFLYEVLLARESLGSTGIGDGIAIPHVRNPVVLHVAQPTVTLCFLEHPIDFEAIDAQPVHTLFTLISPTVRSHLRMLSQLSFSLRKPSFRQVIREQGVREAILAEVVQIESDLALTPPATAGGTGATK
ncbi:MAG: PTS sugar transporter subunit IIA [Phycisphaerae bacterium]|nr:PTS sugar transporter subunit IIA [Phycisphaerae bacterium]